MSFLFGKKCPLCGTSMKKSGMIKPKKGKRKTYGEKTVYRCPKCGHRTL